MVGQEHRGNQQPDSAFDVQRFGCGQGGTEGEDSKIGLITETTPAGTERDGVRSRGAFV